MPLTLPRGQFCGDAVATLARDGVHLTETVYSPGLRLPRHSHERACFIFVVTGTFTETYGTRTRDCGPSLLIYRPIGEVHSDHFRDRGARCLNIEINSGWHDHARQFSAVLDDSAEFHHGPPHELALKIYREFQQRDAMSPLAIGGLALELMAEMARASVRDSTSSRWLEQAKEIVHARYSESLSVSEIATAVGVHPAHLSRTFRRTYGCTIGEYQRRLRVDYSCQQLITSDLPLVDIAHAAGFYDQGHFSRTFKRHTRLSPARYRSTYRTR